jgi:hypothetical protein
VRPATSTPCSLAPSASNTNTCCSRKPRQPTAGAKPPNAPIYPRNAPPLRTSFPRVAQGGRGDTSPHRLGPFPRCPRRGGGRTPHPPPGPESSPRSGSSTGQRQGGGRAEAAAAAAPLALPLLAPLPPAVRLRGGAGAILGARLVPLPHPLSRPRTGRVSEWGKDGVRTGPGPKVRLSKAPLGLFPLLPRQRMPFPSPPRNKTVCGSGH